MNHPATKASTTRGKSHAVPALPKQSLIQPAIISPRNILSSPTPRKAGVQRKAHEYPKIKRTQAYSRPVRRRFRLHYSGRIPGPGRIKRPYQPAHHRDEQKWVENYEGSIENFPAIKLWSCLDFQEFMKTTRVRHKNGN